MPREPVSHSDHINGTVHLIFLQILAYWFGLSETRSSWQFCWNWKDYLRMPHVKSDYALQAFVLLPVAGRNHPGCYSIHTGTGPRRQSYLCCLMTRLGIVLFWFAPKFLQMSCQLYGKIIVALSALQVLTAMFLNEKFIGFWPSRFTNLYS